MIKEDIFSSAFVVRNTKVKITSITKVKGYNVINNFLGPKNTAEVFSPAFLSKS